MIKDTVPGVVGNCVSGSAFTVAWVTSNVMPWLHIISVVVGIVASVGTAGYYIAAWREGRHKKTRRKVVRKK